MEEQIIVVIDEAAHALTGRAGRGPTTTVSELIREIIGAGRAARVTRVEKPPAARGPVRLPIQVATPEALDGLPSDIRQIAVSGEQPATEAPPTSPWDLMVPPVLGRHDALSPGDSIARFTTPAPVFKDRPHHGRGPNSRPGRRCDEPE
jgi:hypothetical protein